MLNFMEWNSTFSTNTQGSENTSAWANIPFGYIRKINAWLSLKTSEQDLDSTSAISVLPDRSTILEELYMFREPMMVQNFLLQHPFLTFLLIEANPHIKKYFPGAPLALEVVRDPEEPLNTQLVVYIVTSLTSDKALNQRDQLADQWWLGARRRARQKLAISIEYQ